MARIAYFYREMSEYIQIDVDLLRERHDVTLIECRSRWPRPLHVLRLVSTHDAIMSWFASWHSLFPALACRALGRPMVITVGGYDTARLPEIGYGSLRGGAKRWTALAAMRLATRLIVISEFTRRETLGLGMPAEKLALGYLGLDPARYPDPGVAREPLVVTVGGVNESNLARKGLESFVLAASRVPEARFVVVGGWTDGAIDRLRALAPPNVAFAGRASHEEKSAWLWRASVVVQASRHEAFGLSLAEGMLCGAVPVVTDAGALPEVVGSAGIVVGSHEPDEIAAGVRRALGLGPVAGAAARERILIHFSIAKRRVLLEAIVAGALARRRQESRAQPAEGNIR